jgi:hypothetical protein
MSQQQREHVKRYVSSYKRWKEKNLGEHHCHTVAAAFARKEFPLSEDEQREVDAWLDERCQVKTEKAECTDDPLSNFDLLPSAW